MAEPITQEKENKYVIFTDHKDIWKMYKQQVASFWTVEEIDLDKDHNDWEKLTDHEQHFFKNVLAFFAGSDGIVLEKFSGKGS